MQQQVVEAIEQYVYGITKGVSPVHGFCHLKRTAIGARWFSQIFGGTEEEQDIAYVAGLIHDLKRPSSEKIDHTHISIDEAKKVMVQFSVDEKTAHAILQLIEDHRVFHEVSLLKQSVFLSDKILEQSGAYVVFRRSFYIGECIDFREIPFEEAVISYWTKRMKKFSPENYLVEVRDLAVHQFEKQTLFLNAFIKKQAWARHLAMDFYTYGRNNEGNLDMLIESYTTAYEQVKILQQETDDYIHGKNYDQFRTMISIPGINST